MSDQEILDHLMHNKYSAALKGLYNVLPDVKRYVIANNGSANDAEDVFQDALVVLYKKVHAGNLVLTVPLKTYLLAVVRNCWLQELRQQKKMPAANLADEIAVIDQDEEPLYNTATDAFKLLGEKCRQLLIMFYFKKKTFREIAAELAFSSEELAKNQKYRCMQKARAHYEAILKSSHER